LVGLDDPNPRVGRCAVTLLLPIPQGVDVIGTWGMLSDLQLSTADRDYDACVGDLVEAGAVPVGEYEIAWYDPGG